MKAVIILCIMIMSSISLANRESGGRPSTSAVYVDFRSFGEGIDLESEITFQVLRDTAMYRGEIVEEVTERVGREGEVRYCVHLSNATQRVSFIRSLKYSILSDTENYGGQRTAVYVGLDCHSFDSVTEQDLNRY